MPSLLVRLPFWLYRVILSPALHLVTGAHAGCRFEPTCSRYAEEALRTHGWLRGGRLAAARLMRCHPFSRGGIDPVPRYDIASSSTPRKVSVHGS